MASKLNISCGSCGYEDISKNAKKWCTICEEGFCGECEKYHKSMKRFASDLQVFLGMHQLNKTISKKIGSLKEEIRNCTKNRMEIEVNHVISSLVNEVKLFGEIKVMEITANLQLKDAKIDQAQIQVHGLSQNIHNISLKLKQKFDIKGSKHNITGCIVLPDNRIIVADYNGCGKLMEYNTNGQHIRDIPVSNKPFSLTLVDTDCIAVTYGEFEYLEIINTKNTSEMKRVNCNSNCWGISYQDHKLYVSVWHQGIVVMDLNGKTLNTIDIDVFSVQHIATTSDRIYYTNYNSNTVQCCSMTGQTIWEFQDRSIIIPRGISVDHNQNVYVAGESSNNLIVIQHDGKDSKVLLTNRDGLKSPNAVNYNKQKKIICLGYKAGSVALYQVS